MARAEAGGGEPDRILINTGGGLYQDETSSRLTGSVVINRSLAARFCDIDADGDKDNDLVLGTGEPTQGGINQVNRVLINSVSGFFTDETAYRVSFEQGTNTLSIKYLDVDGDGDLDVFACNDPITPPTIAGRAVLWINDGKGFFSDETALRLPFGVFNGKPDIYIARAGQDVLLVNRNPGTSRP